MALGNLMHVSVLSSLTVPDPVLRSPAAQVADSRFGSASLERLINSMHETMDAVDGVGLAGPQVGVSQAIFVFHLDDRRGHIINPHIETWGATMMESREGCLSVPELYFTPPRYQYAKVTGKDHSSLRVKYQGEGLFARMLQHEVDHLFGYLFVDRLEDEQFRQARRAMASPEFNETAKRVASQRSANISSAFGTGSAFSNPTS